MPSSKWRSERSGPNWLMDEQGRLIGYRDEQGNEYKMPSEPAPGGVTDSDEPASSVSGAGENLLLSTVLFVGDSLEDQGYPSAANEGTSALHWLALACAELGGCFTKYVNGGVSGQNTAQILARVPTLLAANNPAVVVFGPNSVNDGAAGFTSDQTIANLKAAFDAALNYPGVRWVVVSTIHSISSLTQATAGAGERRRYYRAVEAFIRGYAIANSGRVKLNEFAAALTTADGSGSNPAFMKADATHLNYQGAYRVARLAVKPWLSTLPRAEWVMPSLTVDHTNLLGPIGIPSGDNAAGSNGFADASSGRITGTGPNGWNVRNYTGDSTSTAASSMVASPVNLPNNSAQLVLAGGAAYGGVGYAIGRETSARNRFDNARANSQAYTYGERISVGNGAWTRALVGQVFTPGNSAAASPDFSAVIPGDMVTDGTVVWLITERPQPGDTILMEADMSLIYTSGSGAHVGVWMQLASSTGQTVDRFLNFAADPLGTTMPTVADSARRLYRQTFVIPATHTDVRSMPMMPMLWMQAADARATMQVHRCSIRRIG